MAARSFGSTGPFAIASANATLSAATLCGCTTLPSRADDTSCAAPHDAVQITGVPAASDSLTSMPQPSNRLGRTAQSARASDFWTTVLETAP